jgi:hypothetical protein
MVQSIALHVPDSKSNSQGTLTGRRPGHEPGTEFQVLVRTFSCGAA